MKRIVWHVLIVLTIFVCGYGMGLLIHNPGKAEAAYGCTYYTSASCFNSGGLGDEVYVDLNFSRAMTFTGQVASTTDKKSHFIYLKPR